MKHLILPLVLTTLAAMTLSASAQDAAVAKEQAADKIAGKLQATKFIRVDRNEKNVYLQTAITRYTRDGVTVDLIGAIHIADASYYTRLNKLFTNYEALLFEMVGGDKINPDNTKHGNRKAVADDRKNGFKDPLLLMLGGIYKGMGKLLQLQGQKEGINYKAKNFVHADLTLEEFEKLQKEKGESLLGFALKNANKHAGENIKQPDLQKLLSAFFSGNPNGLKLELVDTLGGAGDQLADMAGESVIIGDRNAACLKVLEAQIKAGKKKLGIFYGAAHFQDMEKHMLKAGYQKTSHHWLTAWNIPKAAAAKKKADGRVPDAD